MQTHRRPVPRRRGQVLIILLGSMFLGGAAALAAGVYVTGLTTKQIDKALQREVADEGRRRAARRVVDSWAKDADRFLESMEERRTELVDRFREYGADRAAIDALLERQDTAVDDLTRRVIDYRFELRDHLTAEEWRAVFGPAVDEAQAGR